MVSGEGWFRAKPEGLELSFNDALDKESATDPGNFHLEQWNYRWIARYGSPHYSVKDPNQVGHDDVPVQSIQLSADHKTLFLKTPSLTPVMQMKITYRIRTEKGQLLKQDIYHTINTIP